MVTSLTCDRGRRGIRPAAALARRSAALPTRGLSGTPNPKDVARESASGGAGAGSAGALVAVDPINLSGVRDCCGMDGFADAGAVAAGELPTDAVPIAVARADAVVAGGGGGAAGTALPNDCRAAVAAPCA